VEEDRETVKKIQSAESSARELFATPASHFKQLLTRLMNIPARQERPTQVVKEKTIEEKFQLLIKVGRFLCLHLQKKVMSSHESQTMPSHLCVGENLFV
jgi:hypothetical protein